MSLSSPDRRPHQPWTRTASQTRVQGSKASHDASRLPETSTHVSHGQQGHAAWQPDLGPDVSIPLRPLRCWASGDRLCAVLYGLQLVTTTNAAAAVLGQGDQEALGLHEDSEGKAVPARDSGTAACRLHGGGTPYLGTVCWRIKGGQDWAPATCLLCDQAAPALSPPSVITPWVMAVSSHAGLHRVQAPAAAAPTAVEYTGSMHSCMAWQGAKAEA